MKTTKKPARSYTVQVILGSRFEDLVIEAATPDEALALAKERTSIRHRFARFVL